MWISNSPVWRIGPSPITTSLLLSGLPAALNASAMSRGPTEPNSLPSADAFALTVTVIAVELAWIGVTQSARPVSAQAAATPVIIRGVELADQRAYLPVGIVGAYQRVPDPLTRTLNPVVANIDDDPCTTTAPQVGVSCDCCVTTGNPRERPSLLRRGSAWLPLKSFTFLAISIAVALGLPAGG